MLISVCVCAVACRFDLKFTCIDVTEPAAIQNSVSYNIRYNFCRTILGWRTRMSFASENRYIFSYLGSARVP